MKRSFSHNDMSNSTESVEPLNKIIKNDNNNLQNKRLFSDSDCSKNSINEDDQPNSRPKLNNTNCFDNIFDTVKVGKIVNNITIQKASEQSVSSVAIFYGTNNICLNSHNTIERILNNISEADYNFLGINRKKSYDPFEFIYDNYR